MLEAKLKKNDKVAYGFIITVSVVVFIVVAFLAKFDLNVTLPFNPHVFAHINGFLNSSVSILLVAALIAVKNKKYELHSKLMFTAIIFSVLFLVSYIAHHLLTGETKYLGEGISKLIYLTILITHIILAGIILPFILITAYRSLTGEYEKHKKIAKITFPIWLYVSVTGVIVYLMISPYYV